MPHNEVGAMPQNRRSLSERRAHGVSPGHGDIVGSLRLLDDFRGHAIARHPLAMRLSFLGPLSGALFAIVFALGQSYPAPAPVFSNLFGGVSGTAAATGLAVDGQGNVAVLGTTNSPDFPVTNAYQPRVSQP